MRLATLVLLLLARAAGAQSSGAPEPLLTAETLPVLVGGIEALQAGIRYPEAERRAGVEGRVIVRFVVGPDGVPVDAEVVRSVSRGLDSAAVAAVVASRFTPGVQDGQRVSVRFTLPVSFRFTAERTARSAAALVPGEEWDPPSYVVADSGTVVDGQGRLVFLAPTEGAERVVISVQHGRVVENETVFSSGSPLFPRIVEIAGQFSSAASIQPRPDGFYHAVDLVALGVPASFDLAFDIPARTYRMRASRCQTSSPAAGCVSMFPMLIGGFGGVVDRSRLPRTTQQPFPEGRVVYAVEVDGEGRVASAEMVSTTFAASPVSRRITDGLRDSLLESRFVVDPNRADQESIRVTIPFTFRSND